MSREEHVRSGLAMTMADDERHVDFGTFLRRAREHRGLSLQQLAVSTKISSRVLEALERNDPSKLPGGLFSRGFVRAYASEVGLDPELAVANFVSAFPEASGADEMPSATRAVEVASFEQRRRALKVFVRLLSVVALVAVLVVMYVSWTGRKRAAATTDALQTAAPVAGSEISVAPQGQTPGPEPGSANPPAAQAADGSPGAAVPADAVQAQPPAPVAQGPLPASAPAAAQPPPTPDPLAAAGSQQAPLLVVLTLSDTCWLFVSVDGKPMPSRVYDAGEHLEYAVQRSITMTAGNAGAVSMTLNGRAARPLGAAGEVVKTTILASGYETFLR